MIRIFAERALSIDARVSSLYHGVRRSRFLRDAGKLGSGVALAQLIALGFTPILTRLFSPSDFGVFSVVVAVSGMLSIVASLRLGLLVPTVRRASVALKLVKVVFVLSCLTAMATAVAIALFAEPLARLLSIPPAAGAVLWLVPPLVLTTAISQTLRAHAVRRRRFGGVARAQVAKSLAATVAWLLLGWAAVLKLPGLALGAGQMFGEMLFGLVLLLRLHRRERRYALVAPLAEALGELRRERRMVGALVGSQTLAAIYGRLPVIVIAAAYGPVLAGFYALAERLVAAPLSLIAASLGDVYRQRAARMHLSGQRFDALMCRIVRLTLALSIVPAVLGVWLAGRHAGFLLGEEWAAASFTLAVLIGGAFFSFNATPVDKAAIIVGASRYIVRWHLLRCALECAFAAGALSGALSYETFLVALVAGRALLYLWDLRMEHRFAMTGRGR